MSEQLKEKRQRAREIIEQLTNLDNSKRPAGGVHGQVIGCEPYIIRTTGFGLQCLWEAGALLDDLLDPFDRRAAPTEPAERLNEEPLSPARVKAITDAIQPGDGWDGDNWDYAVANRAFMAGFSERGKIMREISALAQAFDDGAPAAPAVPQKPYLSHFATLNEYKAAQAVYEAATAPPSPSVDQAKRLVGGEVARPGAWNVLHEDDKPDVSRRLDVILTNGVCLMDRTYQKIDWTQVADWRYSQWPEAPDRASTGSATSTDTAKCDFCDGAGGWGSGEDADGCTKCNGSGRATSTADGEGAA